MTKSNDKFLKVLTEIARIIVGTTFLFSGFVKAVDPHGFAYKIQDYLISFDLTGLFSWALPAAVLLVVVEFLVGVFLLLGIYRKAAVVATAVFMAFFLPLTLWIALANPVKDCGCFGDALIIDNWETFYKNLLLSACTVVLLLNRRRITPLFSPERQWMAAVYCVVFGFSFAVYNVEKLPVFDFRPYKIGANIPEQMYIDPAKTDIVENVFVYRKNGTEQEFTEENYPWNDSTWTFVEMKTKIIKEGEKPKIEDFRIERYRKDSISQEYFLDEDITAQLLSDTDYVFLMVSYSLEKMNPCRLDRFVQASEYAKEHGYRFYLLTASPSGAISEWDKAHGLSFDVAFCDERVLKTMIRSNPGLMLIKSGTVVNMWGDGDVPDFHRKKEIASVEGIKNSFAAKMVLILLMFLLPLTILKCADMRRTKKRRI